MPLTERLDFKNRYFIEVLYFMKNYVPANDTFRIVLVIIKYFGFIMWTSPIQRNDNETKCFSVQRILRNLLIFGKSLDNLKYFQIIQLIIGLCSTFFMTAVLGFVYIMKLKEKEDISKNLPVESGKFFEIPQICYKIYSCYYFIAVFFSNYFLEYSITELIISLFYYGGLCDDNVRLIKIDYKIAIDQYFSGLYFNHIVTIIFNIIIVSNLCVNLFFFLTLSSTKALFITNHFSFSGSKKYLFIKMLIFFSQPLFPIINIFEDHVYKYCSLALNLLAIFLILLSFYFSFHQFAYYDNRISKLVTIVEAFIFVSGITEFIVFIMNKTNITTIYSIVKFVIEVLDTLAIYFFFRKARYNYYDKWLSKNFFASSYERLSKGEIYHYIYLYLNYKKSKSKNYLPLFLPLQRHVLKCTDSSCPGKSLIPKEALVSHLDMNEWDTDEKKEYINEDDRDMDGDEKGNRESEGNMTPLNQVQTFRKLESVTKIVQNKSQKSLYVLGKDYISLNKLNAKKVNQEKSKKKSVEKQSSITNSENIEASLLPKSPNFILKALKDYVGKKLIAKDKKNLKTDGEIKVNKEYYNKNSDKILGKIMNNKKRNFAGKKKLDKSNELIQYHSYNEDNDNIGEMINLKIEENPKSIENNLEKEPDNFDNYRLTDEQFQILGEQEIVNRIDYLFKRHKYSYLEDYIFLHIQYLIKVRKNYKLALYYIGKYASSNIKYSFNTQYYLYEIKQYIIDIFFNKEEVESSSVDNFRKEVNPIKAVYEFLCFSEKVRRIVTNSCLNLINFFNFRHNLHNNLILKTYAKSKVLSVLKSSVKIKDNIKELIKILKENYNKTKKRLENSELCYILSNFLSIVYGEVNDEIRDLISPVICFYSLFPEKTQPLSSKSFYETSSPLILSISKSDIFLVKHISPLAAEKLRFRVSEIVEKDFHKVIFPGAEFSREHSIYMKQFLFCGDSFEHRHTYMKNAEGFLVPVSVRVRSFPTFENDFLLVCDLEFNDKINNCEVNKVFNKYSFLLNDIFDFIGVTQNFYSDFGFNIKMFRELKTNFCDFFYVDKNKLLKEINDLHYLTHKKSKPQTKTQNHESNRGSSKNVTKSQANTNSGNIYLENLAFTIFRNIPHELVFSLRDINGFCYFTKNIRNQRRIREKVRKKKILKKIPELFKRIDENGLDFEWYNKVDYFKARLLLEEVFSEEFGKSEKITFIEDNKEKYKEYITNFNSKDNSKGLKKTRDSMEMRTINTWNLIEHKDEIKQYHRQSVEDDINSQMRKLSNCLQEGKMIVAFLENYFDALYTVKKIGKITYIIVDLFEKIIYNRDIIDTFIESSDNDEYGKISNSSTIKKNRSIKKLIKTSTMYKYKKSETLHRKGESSPSDIKRYYSCNKINITKSGMDGAIVNKTTSKLFKDKYVKEKLETIQDEDTDNFELEVDENKLPKSQEKSMKAIKEKIGDKEKTMTIKEENESDYKINSKRKSSSSNIEETGIINEGELDLKSINIEQTKKENAENINNSSNENKYESSNVKNIKKFVKNKINEKVFGIIDEEEENGTPENKDDDNDKDNEKDKYNDNDNANNIKNVNSNIFRLSPTKKTDKTKSFDHSLSKMDSILNASNISNSNDRSNMSILKNKNNSSISRSRVKKNTVVQIKAPEKLKEKDKDNEIYYIDGEQLKKYRKDSTFKIKIYDYIIIFIVIAFLLGIIIRFIFSFSDKEFQRGLVKEAIYIEVLKLDVYITGIMSTILCTSGAPYKNTTMKNYTDLKSLKNLYLYKSLDIMADLKLLQEQIHVVHKSLHMKNLLDYFYGSINVSFMDEHWMLDTKKSNLFKEIRQLFFNLYLQGTYENPKCRILILFLDAVSDPMEIIKLGQPTTGERLIYYSFMNIFAVFKPLFDKISEENVEIQRKTMHEFTWKFVKINSILAFCIIVLEIVVLLRIREDIKMYRKFIMFFYHYETHQIQLENEISVLVNVVKEFDLDDLIVFEEIKSKNDIFKHEHCDICKNDSLLERLKEFKYVSPEKDIYTSEYNIDSKDKINVYNSIIKSIPKEFKAVSFKSDSSLSPTSHTFLDKQNLNKTLENKNYYTNMDNRINYQIKSDSKFSGVSNFSNYRNRYTNSFLVGNHDNSSSALFLNNDDSINSIISNANKFNSSKVPYIQMYYQDQNNFENADNNIYGGEESPSKSRMNKLRNKGKLSKKSYDFSYNKSNNKQSDNNNKSQTNSIIEKNLKDLNQKQEEINDNENFNEDAEKEDDDDMLKEREETIEFIKSSFKLIPTSFNFHTVINILVSVIILGILFLNLRRLEIDESNWKYAVNLSMNFLERIPCLLELALYYEFVILTGNLDFLPHQNYSTYMNSTKSFITHFNDSSSFISPDYFSNVLNNNFYASLLMDNLFIKNNLRDLINSRSKIFENSLKWDRKMNEKGMFCANAALGEVLGNYDESISKASDLFEKVNEKTILCMGNGNEVNENGIELEIDFILQELTNLFIDYCKESKEHPTPSPERTQMKVKYLYDNTIVRILLDLEIPFLHYFNALALGNLNDMEKINENSSIVAIKYTIVLLAVTLVYILFLYLMIITHIACLDGLMFFFELESKKDNSFNNN